MYCNFISAANVLQGVSECRPVYEMGAVGTTDRGFPEALAEVGQREGVDDVLVVRIERSVWGLVWLRNAKRYRETWTRDHATAHDEEEDKFAGEAEAFEGETYSLYV